MTASRMTFPKSETRDFADQDRLSMTRLGYGEPTEWKVSNRSFFTAFVVIAAVLAMLALLVR